MNTLSVGRIPFILAILYSQKDIPVRSINMKWIFSTLAFCFCLTTAQAQYEAQNIGNAVLVNMFYGFAFPAADLADRFDYGFEAGLGVDYMLENNFLFGVQGGIVFGSQVKEDVISSLRTPAGSIIGNNRLYASVQLRMRGLNASAHVGKLFGILKDNPRSGIRATFGMGLFQHRVRIQEDPESFVPQLSGDYKKGYDRLSNGLSLTQFIGYQHLSTNGLLNLTFGFEFVEAFTQSRRDINFDTMSADTSMRFDMLIGMKLGYTLPFYSGKGDGDVFY